MNPRIGLLLGNLTGISSELVAKVLSQWYETDRVDIVVVGE